MNSLSEPTAAIRRIAAVIALVLSLLLCGGAAAQIPVLTGLGLSGRAGMLDSLVVDGDTLQIIASFTETPDWNVAGVGFRADSLHWLRLYVYSQGIPAGTPAGMLLQRVDTNAVSIDRVASPPRLTIRLRLPAIVNPEVHSLQIEMAVFARHAAGDLAVGTRRTSHARVGGVEPLNNAVSGDYATYLAFRDLITYPPVVFSPQSNSLQARLFDLRYSQPEQAQPGSVVLEITNLDTLAAEPPHRLILRDASPSPLRTIPLNTAQLFHIAYMDSFTGGTALTQGAAYRFVLSYRDVNLNPASADTVQPVRIDRLTDPPVIQLPRRDDRIGSHFELRYSQPEDAALGTLLLMFTTTASPDTIYIYLRDRGSGSEKIVLLQSADLFDPAQMDSLLGNGSLLHGAVYTIHLQYSDILRNFPASTQVWPVHADFRSDPALLFEPRRGSSTTDSTVRIIFELPEPADSVWLTFKSDTAITPVADTLSPHILLLTDAFERSGVHTLFLEGWRIGSENEYVEQNNNGLFDNLVYQCAYSVTLTYGDTLGNENFSVSNSGYIWPRDLLTTPARIVQPRIGGRDNATFRIVFDLPEPPLPGSLYLRFSSLLPTDPGSPHQIYLEDLPAGRTGFFLNGTQLHYSDLVDSVTGPGNFEQNNRLVDGERYLITLRYRDEWGNPEAASTPVIATFDNRTQPVTIIRPAGADTFSRADYPVVFDQPETALPGTMKFVLSQIGGPEIDIGAPHTLYLTDRSAANGKTVLLQPASLVATPGLDSLSGTGLLHARAVYRLTIEYQDTLDNAPASRRVDSLLYPSGTTVYAEGGALGSGVVEPGETRSLRFRLSLRTISGVSALRGIRFRVDGDAQAADLLPAETILWASVDTVFSQQDLVVARLSGWAGGTELAFANFARIIDELETHFLVTLAFPPTANPARQIRLYLPAATALDCSGDPVIAPAWPIGTRDVPLAVTVTEFSTEQDTAFGALRILWTAAAETENAGFLLSRRAEDAADFAIVATYATAPELVGRGTVPTSGNYLFIDRGLLPGKRYFYRLAAQSYNLDVIEIQRIAEGVPRLPPDNFMLLDAYPNPFNQDVTLSYVVPYTAKVEIVIYDLLGRNVRTLVRAVQAPSLYNANWDSRNDAGLLVPSGVYFYRLRAGGTFDASKKMLLVR